MQTIAADPKHHGGARLLSNPFLAHTVAARPFLSRPENSCAATPRLKNALHSGKSIILGGGEQSLNTRRVVVYWR